MALEQPRFGKHKEFSPAPAAQPAHVQPVAIADGTFNHNCPIGTPLYTTPPAAQRQWVGLTNEQREVIISSSMTPACVLIATETKLKEKNNG